MSSGELYGPSVNIYPVTNYQIGRKQPQFEKDRTEDMRSKRRREQYEKFGMRRSVEAVLLVHQHSHPHVLLLQIGSFFKLPGGKLHTDESELDGLRRKLTRRLAPPNCPSSVDRLWDVADLVGVFWRPNFEAHLPYLPAHITKPKECKKVYMVRMPPKMMLAVPANLRIVAVPLFELHNNAKQYGPIIAMLPTMLSRYTYNFMVPRNMVSTEPQIPVSEGKDTQIPDSNDFQDEENHPERERETEREREIEGEREREREETGGDMYKESGDMETENHGDGEGDVLPI